MEDYRDITLTDSATATACTRRARDQVSQLASMDGGGTHEVQALAEKLSAIDGFWGMKSLFTSVVVPGVPEDGPTPMRTPAALDGLGGFEKET